MRPDAIWGRTAAALGGGGLVMASLIVNLAWLPLSLDVAALIALLVAIPAWCALALRCYWVGSLAGAWRELALIGGASIAVNLAMTLAR